MQAWSALLSLFFVLGLVQVLGGYGYCDEYQVERLWRDAKLLEIGGGTLEAHHKNMVSCANTVSCATMVSCARSVAVVATNPACRLTMRSAHLPLVHDAFEKNVYEVGG